MCGLIGMIAKTPSGFYSQDKETFTQMLYADAVRGKDATGVFAVNKVGNVEWMKQAAPSGWFISTKTYKEFEPKIVQNFHVVIGHNRKATHGDKKDADAHPFIKNNITLVHNGMIRNHKELCDESTVDSNALTKALANGADVEEVLRKVEGAFALIWYDGRTKNVHFIRNKERPLHIVESDKAWYLASEALLAGWTLDRNNNKILGTKECVVDTLYTINLDKKEITEKPLDLKKRYPVISNSRYFRQNDSFYDWGSDEEDTLFLDEDTIERPGLLWATKGKQIMMEVTEYTDFRAPNFSGTQVELTGKILNGALKGPTIKAIVPLVDMEEILESCVVHGQINTIKYGATPIIELILATPASFKETKNGLFVSEEMYMSEHFPVYCSVCNKNRIIYDQLESVETKITYHSYKDPEVKCVCEECLQKEQACTLALN